YESLCYLAIFFFLRYLYWKTDKRYQLGYIFGWFMILLWSARFFTEYFKSSQGGIDTFFNLGLSTGQLLSIPFVIIGVTLLFYNSRYQAAYKRLTFNKTRPCSPENPSESTYSAKQEQ